MCISLPYHTKLYPNKLIHMSFFPSLNKYYYSLHLRPLREEEKNNSGSGLTQCNVISVISAKFIIFVISPVTILNPLFRPQRIRIQNVSRTAYHIIPFPVSRLLFPVSCILYFVFHFSRRMTMTMTVKMPIYNNIPL